MSKSSSVSEQPKRAPSPSVTRRHVFYIGGFDPRGPAHYHRLYRDNARAQAEISGAQVIVGERENTAEHSSVWPVQYKVDADSPPVLTQVEFLRWDDIVRANWPRSLLREGLDTLGTAYTFARSGAFERIRKVDWRPYSALVFPPMLLLLLLVLPLLNLALYLAGSSAGVSALASSIALILFDMAVLLFALSCERRLRMRWLMRTFVFTRRQAQGAVANLEDRLDGFAQALCARCAQGGVDEVLLVGHSLGTMLAPTVLARALAMDPELASRGPALSLLTLGQCSPMLSTLPEAKRFRDELAALARAPGFDWVDFTAPSDYCAAALADPVVAAGLGPAPLPDRPKLLSTRVATLFTPERYAQLRKDPFQLHFQYIMAGQLAGSYDYFEITAGAQTLGVRHADQASVKGYRRGK